MLKELFIQNFAVIERLRLTLEEGLNVLTGETGTGKSIVVDALGLLLGNRASSDLVRSGAEKAVVEGFFINVNQGELEKILAELEIDPPENDQLILTREISRQGRSICRINGRVTTLQSFQGISRYLVGIHGQHQYQELLSSPEHLNWLDQFVGREALELRDRVGTVYKKAQAVRRELEELRADAARRIREAEFLKYQLDEIEKAALKPGEEEELRAEERLLVNAEKLKELGEESYNLLFGETGAYGRLAGAFELMGEISGLDPQFEELKAEAENAMYTVEEISRPLRSYLENIEFNPGRLEQVQQRLAEITRITRKYGGTAEATLAYREEAATLLERVENSEELALGLEEEQKKAEAELERLATALTELRQKGAAELSRGVRQELQDLMMAGTSFEVKFKPLTAPSALGAETVEFYFAPNPGEPAKPLAKTASGGELSRVMLALNNCLAAGEAPPTLVFDEVDAGVGGRAARAVAVKLAAVARTSQVICVTHSPQIASFAHRQYKIEKQVHNGRTFTTVTPLSHEARLTELARMLTGSETDLALRHARELLAESGKST